MSNLIEFRSADLHVVPDAAGLLDVLCTTVAMDASNEQPKCVSDYVGDLCAEMIGMAEAAELHLLAYLLDMARLEAQSVSRRYGDAARTSET